MKVAKCQHCGRAYEGARKSRYCSNRCSLKGRGVAWFRAHQARMVATRKARGYSRLIARLKAAGLTDVQIALVRAEVQRVRVNSHTAGKRLGWAEALGERDDREVRA